MDMKRDYAFVVRLSSSSFFPFLFTSSLMIFLRVVG